MPATKLSPKAEALNSLLRAYQFFRGVDTNEAKSMGKLVSKAWEDASPKEREGVDPSLVAGFVSTFLDTNAGLASAAFAAIEAAGVTPKSMINRRVVGGTFRIVGIDPSSQSVKLDLLDAPRMMAAETELPPRRKRRSNNNNGAEA